ncbi:SGNH/GDSL hydrolase family protein [Sphingomonas arantia]|uniref:SGNH/GDSL hydrolase family protein n=1 Tax=Sphingomonas arantia TaxID=1460676 RepID=A0ABW4U3Q9_9SPHN
MAYVNLQNMSAAEKALLQAGIAAAGGDAAMRDTSLPLNRLKSHLLRFGLSPQLPTVMPVVNGFPTVTVGTIGQAPFVGATSVNRYLKDNVGEKWFSMSRGRDAWPYTFTYNGIDYYNGPPGATETTSLAAIGMIHDGRFLGVYSRWNDQVQMIVDGQFVTTPFISLGAGTGAQGKPLVVDFGSSARRSIIYLTRTSGFAGFRIGAGDTLEPLDLSQTPRMSMLSDSYGGSTSRDIPGGGNFGNAAVRLGIYDFSQSPGGGSGYITLGTGGKVFGEASRVAAMVAGSPDLVYVSGGVNDGIPGIGEAAAALFTQLREALPKAVIAVQAPWSPNGENIDSAIQKRDLIFAAARALPGPWVLINSLAGTWENSSGRTGRAGNAPWQTGDGRGVSFTTALDAATAGTLTSGWNGGSGSRKILFDDGSVRDVVMTAGSAAVTWTGAVSHSAGALATAYTSVAGNSRYISDGTHYGSEGNNYGGGSQATALRAAILAIAV